VSRGETAGTQNRRLRLRIPVLGAALNITALVFCPGSTPSCQRRRKAVNILPGRLDSFPGAVAPAPAKFSDSALMERSGKAGRQWGDRAAESSLARSPAARCQTNLVLPVRPASFAEWSALERSPTEWKISERSESWPVSRLMRRPARTKSRGLMLVSSATGGASRRNADALPVRSIAGYC
jgi:hypothetical protein